MYVFYYYYIVDNNNVSELIIKTTTMLRELTKCKNNNYIINKKAKIDTAALLKGSFSHPSTHEVTHLCQQSHHGGMMSTPNHQQAQFSPVHQSSHS